MKTLDQWLAEYSQAHQHPINQTLHKICVPAIGVSLLAMLWSIHPVLALLVSAGVLYYYSQLSMQLTGVVLMAVVFCFALFTAIPQLFLVALLVFGLAWAGQFVGHYLEGKRPSFMQDVRFLLIGPLWSTEHFMRWVGRRR